MYEFCNPGTRAVECVIRGKWGTILVPGGTFVPTPEQEEGGIPPETFAEYTPSLLKPTPPALRRRLLEARNLPVPKDVVDATAHLSEFGGEIPSAEVEAAQETVLSLGDTPKAATRASKPEDYKPPVKEEDQSQEEVSDAAESAREKAEAKAADEPKKKQKKIPEYDSDVRKVMSSRKGLEDLGQEMTKITNRKRRKR